MEGLCSEISGNEIKIGEKIGEGMHGVVYTGRCRGYDVAIKVIKEKLDRMNIKSEINIMSQIRFPNVCLFLGACIEPDFFCVVQEYLPGGDLRSLLKEDKLPTSFYARMRLANQVARGMIWIHSAGVLHRDLKLENLLLDKHGEVKVCDFGLSDTIGSQQCIVDNKMKGSPLYMAPEVLLGVGMNKKVDVYSFGLLFWELLAKKRAFQEHLEHNDIEKFADAICVKKERPPIPPPRTTEVAWNNKELVTLLQRCWHEDPNQRPDFEEIYDKLNYLIAGSIQDSWGQSFWLINFPDQYEVTWNEFVEALSSSKTVQMPDGSQLHKGLAIKLLPKHIWESLKTLLGQISGSKILTHVNVESFGKLLDWFGPGVSVKDTQHYTFLENISELCSYDWFHGNIPSARAQELLRSHNEKSFLVRLSSVPGSFVVQTRTTCVRITHKPGGGFLPEGGVTHATLPQLVESTINSCNYIPCPGSALGDLLNQPQNQAVITPYKDVGAIMVLNGHTNQVPDKASAFVAYQLQKEEKQSLERERSKKKLKKNV